MRNPFKTLVVVIGIVAGGMLASAADPPHWAYPRVPSDVGWIHVPDGSGQMEPLGQRIIETAVDTARTSLRDFHSGYVAYVPIGSVRKGEALVNAGGGGKTVQCSLCHGPELKGAGNVPRIAGISAIYTVRQLFDMQFGARNGSGAALMKPVVAKLAEEDMLNIAAYLASLAP